MRTPMAMTASNGWWGIEAATGAGVADREFGLSEVRPPRRSVAVAPAWTWEPAMTLRPVGQLSDIVPLHYALLAGQRQLETPGNRLHDNVTVLHSGSLEFSDGTRDKGVDDGFVPS